MKQCALLIGNNAYPESVLKNAVNDGTSMSAKLLELSFSTTLLADATHKSMDVGLSEFGKQLATHDVGLFFFAGHGMQIDGVNYLAAVDTNFASEVDAKFSSLALDKVIETMERSGTRTSVIILDACRNNPYERRWRTTGPRGLAPVYAPKGMLIGYATSPGQVASDGSGKNGAYTEALLAHIGHQDLSIENFFKRVRNTLSSSTSSRQISWEHTSLMGEYYFNLSRGENADNTAYSPEALADSEFHPRGSLSDIINALKSRHWYTQNPAMGDLNSERLAQAGKDDLFVLGRNVYQAACGGANSAIAMLSALKEALTKFPPVTRFHLLNGMLYEIYFDSKGKKRMRAKAGELDSVFALEDDPLAIASFVFIRNALTPYLDEMFYIPGSRNEVCIDVVIERSPDGPVLSQVCFEGQNVLYNDSGEAYFEPRPIYFTAKDTRPLFKTRLAEALAAPSFRLKASFTGTPVSDDEMFYTVRNPNLQRIAPK